MKYIEGAHSGAVRKMCEACRNSKKPKDCGKKDCPLYPFAPGSSDRTGNSRSENAKKRIAEGKLFPFRKGNKPADPLEFLGVRKKD